MEDRSHLPGRELGAVDAREREDAVDQLRHALGAVHDAPQVVAPHLVELVAAVLDERVAEAGDAAQRGAQIMGHGVGEGLQLAVGELELRGAVGDAASPAAR